jgi:hypothetical protein
MSLVQVKKVVIALLKDDADLTKLFTDTFTDSVASVDIDELLSGNISHDTLISALNSALETTSTEALRVYEVTKDIKFLALSHQLHSPVVTALLSLLPPPDILSRGTSIASTSRTAARSWCTPDPDIKARPSPGASRYAPASVPKRLNIRREQTAPPPLDTDSIHKDVEQFYSTPRVLYSSSRVVTCRRTSCSICRHVFTHLNLTRCVGHKPCTPCGWFPHVTPMLWSGLKKVHADPSLPIAVSYRPPKKDEIRSPWDVEPKPHPPAVTPDGPIDWNTVSPPYPPPSQSGSLDTISEEVHHMNINMASPRKRLREDDIEIDPTLGVISDRGL